MLFGQASAIYPRFKEKSKFPALNLFQRKCYPNWLDQSYLLYSNLIIQMLIVSSWKPKQAWGASAILRMKLIVSLSSPDTPLSRMTGFLTKSLSKSMVSANWDQASACMDSTTRPTSRRTSAWLISITGSKSVGTLTSMKDTSSITTDCSTPLSNWRALCRISLSLALHSSNPTPMWK